VIQKHDASRLHYDFRLQVGRVLKSWAVPKGPSLNPQDKRLAVEVEDHPLNYGDFEGVIPQGEYGGGTVMVWDKGTYRNITEKHGKLVPITRALADGHVAVWLEGKKLKGGFALIHTRRPQEKNWLLIKISDDEADTRHDPLKSKPKSALSGRTMNQIAKDEG
jgi:DNA ligase D-like protein (predicted 3'-phosphoesterase)